MKKQEKNIVYRRLIRSYLSSVVSITLLLFLIGLTGLIMVNATSIASYFRENIKLSLILDEEVEELVALELFDKLKEAHYLKEAHFISKEQGAEEMKELLGEDFLELFETSPIPHSIDLYLKANYMQSDSIELIKRELMGLEGSREVLYQASLVEAINENMEKGGVVAVVLTLLLLLLSTILINNTVRLNLFSKRFTIYTMKLVGAKRSFIRRPFLLSGAVQGGLSALFASGLLGVVLYFIMERLPQLYQILDKRMVTLLFVAIPPLGILLALLTTLFICNRLISLTGDDIY